MTDALKHPDQVARDIARIKARGVLKPVRKDHMCPDVCTGFYPADGALWPCIHCDDFTGMPGPTCPQYLHQRENHVRAWLKRIGVPEHYCDPPDEEQIQHLAELREWAEAVCNGSCSVGLVLAGGKGTGKTTALGWLARQLWKVRRTKTIWFTFAPDLFDRMHESSQAVHDWAAVDVLLLDDFGRQNPSEYAASRWDSLVEKRYGARRPTVLTTNLAPADMDTESRWFDRLKEQNLWLRMTGSSKRSKRVGL